MNNAKVQLLTGLIAAALTQVAAAQSTGTTQGVNQANPAASASASSEQRSGDATLRDVRISQLIGRDVRDPKGEDLGDIKDLVVDLQSGEVRYAVVSFGGFLGLGEKLFAFPLSAFRQAGGDMQASRPPAVENRETSRPTADAADRDARRQLPAAGGLWSSRNELVLNTEKERLEKAPGFDDDRWPDFADAGVRSNIDRYWGDASRERPRAEGERQGQLAQRAGDTAKAGDKQAAAAKTGTWRASELLDADVVAQDGKDIGEIEDIVVNAQDGSIRYAVVAFDEGWFQADKLVSVPTKALSRRDDDELAFNGTKEQLAEAPAFDRDKWPDLNERSYRSSIDRVVGGWGGGPSPVARPEGATSGPGSTPARGDGGTGASTGASTPAGGAPADRGNPRN